MIEYNETFNCCRTIAFKNNSFTKDNIVVWVCKTRQSYEEALIKLKAMDHVEIVQSGDSHVE